MNNRKTNTANADINNDKTFEIYSKMNNTLDRILKVAEDINLNIAQHCRGFYYLISVPV